MTLGQLIDELTELKNKHGGHTPTVNWAVLDAVSAVDYVSGKVLIW